MPLVYRQGSATSNPHGAVTARPAGFSLPDVNLPDVNLPDVNLPGVNLESSDDLFKTAC